MRKLVTISLFAFCFSLTAQDFISMQWNVKITSDDNGHPSKYLRYHFGFDSLIVDEEVFWPLLESSEENGMGGLLYGYFREEGDQIYKYVTENDDEYKFYNVPVGEVVYFDFGLQVGDTISSYIDDYNITVTHIDSIELLDGSFRKSIHLQCIDANWLDNSIWVEGIGDLNFGFEGVKLLCGAPEGDWSLKCYYEDSNLLYKNPEASECFVVSAKDIIDNEFSIYPNPTIDKLYIEGLKEGFSIKILNQVGQLMNISVDNEKEIDIGRLAKGAYYLSIQTNDKTIVKRFIKI